MSDQGKIILEIEGAGAAIATEDLFAANDLDGSWEIVDEAEREVTLATVATIVGIVGGALTIGEKLYQWVQHCKKKEADIKIEKVLLIGKNGRRLLLKDATLDQIKAILDE